MSEIGIADAVRNNAAWCDAICSAHGSGGEFLESHWISKGPTPPFYPNVVTLDSSVSPVVDAVRELDRSRLSGPWGVKDSFAVLPLEQAGFRLVFEAEWIARPAPSLSRPLPRDSRDRSWLRIQSEPALADWEAAWGESGGGERIFLPALLSRIDVAILDADGVMCAGIIANRTEKALGLSNLFLPGQDSGDLRLACIAAAVDTFPGLPLVGYQSGRELEESLELGFHSLGPLRVWQTSD